jgi:hypothetical protein
MGRFSDFSATKNSGDSQHYRYHNIKGKREGAGRIGPSILLKIY